MLTGVSVPEASAHILADIAPLRPERVPLRSALGRVLVRDVVAPVALPRGNMHRWTATHYARRRRGARTESPVTLRVVGTIAAGGGGRRPRWGRRSHSHQTGLRYPREPTPSYASRTQTAGPSASRSVNARDVGRKRASARREDLAAGAVAVAAGTVVGPAQLGVLASVGASHVDVHRIPRVAILSSGDELVDVDRYDDVLAGRRIVASNSYTLWALVQSAGAEAIDLGIVPDDAAALRRRIEEGLASADVLLTSGGVSVGAFDYTREVVSSLGAQLRLWRVRMRPGAPIGFGLVGGVPWIGLPGNPVSAMVTFELFARPALRKMAGHRLLFQAADAVRLEEAVTLAAPLMHFLRRDCLRRWRRLDAAARLNGTTGIGLSPHGAGERARRRSRGSNARRRWGDAARDHAGERRSAGRGDRAVTETGRPGVSREIDALAEQIERRFRTTRTSVSAGAHTIELVHPANADDLITEEDFVRDERLPYWADIWPSAVVLARRIAGERGARRTLLALGCGGLSQRVPLAVFVVKGPLY